MFPGDLQAREAAASKNCLKSSARWTIMMATLHKAPRGPAPYPSPWEEPALRKIRESAENYLETILILQERNGSVRPIDIAAELEFSKPSVSVAMKNLRESGCVTVDGDGIISLTPQGRQIAEGVYERHLLFTKWLVSLGVDQEVASEDACRIEHVISEESFRAIQRHVNARE